MSFHVGQKVVCVDPHGGLGTWVDGEAPVLGAIYTVARAFLREGRRTLHLFEIQRSAFSRQLHGDDCGYNATRFRPVVSRKTDISIFTEILKRKTDDVPLRVELPSDCEAK